MDHKLLMLRPASRDDLEFVISLDEQAKRASTGSSYKDRNSALARTEKMMDDLRYKVLIAEEDDKRLGMVITDLNHPAEELVVSGKSLTTQQIKDVFLNKSGLKRAHIMSIAVISEARGKGVGKQINEKLEEELKSQGYEVVTNDTGINNLALQKSSLGYNFVRVKTNAGDAYDNEKLVGVKFL